MHHLRGRFGRSKAAAGPRSKNEESSMDQTNAAQVEGAPLDEAFRSTRRYYRVGQIVPSSNTTMETEIPAMLRAREGVAPERFTFHSARMRMQHVTKEELAKMDGDSDRCALELSDAPVDVLGYACLVAIMSMGHGYHRESERRLRGVAAKNGRDVPVVTSAGALVDGLRTLGAKRVSIIPPYMKPLTELVKSYIEAEGLTVVDTISLEIANN